ncbi:protein phosphatase CheZ [Kerstersia gyiorum]|uniref:protein phosphatase CheZ n=1 Tax=Kerstersia gyiorum TaxID=206506 RepID=UPI0010710C8E|nr:protein phosphatase CheZ [Kerstersia gyiorum]QBR39950.1 protein phosphatase CheZ [Kerstersia gyiorum]
MDARDSQDQPAATGKEDLFIRVARLTRLLQNSMRELGLDQKVRDAAEVIPDARDRLRYVANLTEQAATRVLGAIEQAQPLQGEIDQGAQALLARWQAGSRAGGVADADLPADTCAYLQTAARNAEATHGHLLDIMMAQDFQDLTGQVIMKLTDLIGTLEKELLQVLLDHVPQEKRDEAEGLLNGPQVRVEGRTDIVSSQDQVDDLLSELGL